MTEYRKKVKLKAKSQAANLHFILNFLSGILNIIRYL